jgi:adenylate cyclase, class 2
MVSVPSRAAARILTPMHGAEIELKFPVSDPLAFSRQVEALGFHLQTERTLEQNTLYDTPARDLRARCQILRLRSYGSRCTVTHKRQPATPDADVRYKTRIETESGVDDCEALAEIFLQLGYVPVFHYEKFRTEWASADTPGHLVLDETPIGTWAELEGDPAWIDAIMAQLGVAFEDSTTLSYGKLFLAWKDATGSPAQHMTFEATQLVASR